MDAEVTEETVYDVVFDPAQWYLVQPVGTEDNVTLRNQRLTNVHACLFFDVKCTICESELSHTLRVILSVLTKDNRAQGKSAHELGITLTCLLAEHAHKCVMEQAIRELRQ